MIGNRRRSGTPARKASSGNKLSFYTPAYEGTLLTQHIDVVSVT